jgi:hypothetical protein
MMDLVGNLIDKIKRYGLAVVFGRYYSLYRAVVTDNKDPLKLGRVKVKVPTLWGETELTSWVLPRDFRGTGVQYGEFYPPKIEDWIIVEFLEGDPQYPIYSGGWFGETELPLEYLHSEENEPLVRGYKTEGGQAILFDESPDEQKTVLKSSSHNFVMDDTKEKEAVYMIHKLGSQWQFDKAGSFKAITKSGHYVTLDEEGGSLSLGSKDGSIIALKDNVVLSDASGESIVTLSTDGVQLTAKAKLVFQCNAYSLDTGAVSISTGSSKIEYQQTFDIAGTATEFISMGAGKVAIGNGAVELVDIVTQALQVLSTTTAPGYGAPISSVGQFAQLYAQLIALKK